MQFSFNYLFLCRYINNFFVFQVIVQVDLKTVTSNGMTNMAKLMCLINTQGVYRMAYMMINTQHFDIVAVQKEIPINQLICRIQNRSI